MKSILIIRVLITVGIMYILYFIFKKSIYRHKEEVMKYIFLLAAFVSVLSAALICIFLFYNAVPAVLKIGAKNFLLGKDWTPTDVPAKFGILPMILGSVYVTIGAILIGVPVGICTAVYMNKFCPQFIYKYLKGAVELLAGIPSIVYGFFGLVVIVPMVRNLFGGRGTSILAASILLGIMILPTIISVSEVSIASVSPLYYEGALALGASHERSVFFATLPAAKSGIIAGVILGIGRAIGETMAVIMVAGNQVRMPNGLFKGIRTLTANIVMEMGYAADLHRDALIATGLVLFVFILIINMLFSFIKRRI